MSRPLKPGTECPTCGEAIDAHPASRRDGQWEGWCSTHGTVVASAVKHEERVASRDSVSSGDEFCHILDAEDKPYCGWAGKNSDEVTCQPYKGEAICPSCGFATCPTCAVMASLNERLEG